MGINKGGENGQLYPKKDLLPPTHPKKSRDLTKAVGPLWRSLFENLYMKKV